MQRMHCLRAREALARLDLLRRLPVWQAAELAHCEGSTRYLLGELETALAVLRRGVQQGLEKGQDIMATRCERRLALVLGELDRLDEARGLLDRHGGGLDAQERHFRSFSRIRILFDIGQMEASLREVATVYEAAGWPLVSRRELGNAAVEVLLAAGRLDEAEAVAGLTRGAGSAGVPEQLALEGRLALARGQVDSAIASLTEAVQIWERAGYRNEESRTRRALAQALARTGDRSGAEHQLRAVLAGALERSAAFEARKAREQLAELGVEVEAAPPVSAAPSLVPTGERLVTVMFADVRGFTGMSQREAPAALTEMVTTFFRWAKQEIERHHGLVDQYAGDAVLATFNVSGARLEHALHALQAAIAIRDKASYGGLPVGMGLAVGPAVVGQLAKDGNVTAVGETVNLAARLQAQASAGEILLSEEAHRRTQDWLQRQPLPVARETLELKGLPQPVVAYRLTAPARAKP